MISLNKNEWMQKKEEWAKDKSPGFRVLVYDKEVSYKNNKSKVQILGKFELKEGGVWTKI